MQNLIKDCESDSDEISDIEYNDESVPVTIQSKEESDIEDCYEDENIQIEMDDDSDSEIEVHNDENNYTNESLLHGRDGTEWRQSPNTTRTLTHNIGHNHHGPVRATKMLSASQILKTIFTDVMCNIIIKETNRKANSVYDEWNAKNPLKVQKIWQDLTLIEFNAYLAILIECGRNHSNTQHTKELWKVNALPLYRASMAINRFWSITRFIRFDNPTSRNTRLLEDKSAAISEIFMLLNANLNAQYTPSDCVVVDEQLFPYRGIYI